MQTNCAILCRKQLLAAEVEHWVSGYTTSPQAMHLNKFIATNWVLACRRGQSAPRWYRAIDKGGAS